MQSQGYNKCESTLTLVANHILSLDYIVFQFYRNSKQKQTTKNI